MSNFSVTTGRDGSRSFGEHDDRWSDSGGSRGGGKQRYRGRGNRGYGGYGGNRGGSYNRGGFQKRGGGGGGGYGRPRGRGRGGPNPRSRLDTDGDFSMDDEAGPSSRERFSPYGVPSRNYSGRGRNKNGDNYAKMQRMGIPITDSDGPVWHKVVIPYGKKGGKDFILKSLSERLHTPFNPVNFHFEQEKAIFYVQEKHEANALRSQDKKIQLPNGFKMILIVKPSPPPITEISSEAVEKLKVCMSSRFDPSTKSLNLSCLAKDQSLAAENIFMALSRRSVMNSVVKVIEENIPELEELDISDNRLISLESMKELPKKAPNVKKLNLGKNKLVHVDELRKIQDWKLEHLILEGNDLCDKFKDQTSYISAIRKKFPKVLTLDGHTLPPPIVFDLETSSELPEVKGSFFINDEIQSSTVNFLKAFFTIYDSDNRQPLMEAYHDEALFSLSAAKNPNIEYSQPNINNYLQESRNFTKMSKDSQARRRLLKRGKINVVAQLCDLPSTTHDYNSFIVDVDHSSASLRSFVVEGVFKETESKSDRPPIRAFSRRFVTVPQGAGMNIINDMLTITNASRDQIQKAFKHPAPTPSSSPVPEASPPAPFTQAGPSTYTAEQQQMIQQFAAQSGMNHEWSIKCLEQNGWNYEKSGEIFLELQKQNKIPPDAFAK
ncbi:nuclear RNA export factor 1-like [Saccostrea echinata]|uniref:nuclear RNA export factor 1-like n=1 Tax=Saccostrea echinata TaxID=191078 RepID=UPI002A8244ED|nr:nuclear RNA export factor 1-like [Saccostrea echinata]